VAAHKDISEFRVAMFNGIYDMMMLLEGLLRARRLAAGLYPAKPEQVVEFAAQKIEESLIARQADDLVVEVQVTGFLVVEASIL
jgi:hypothetical protein